MAAVVLAEPLTPQWHEARRNGIGASEIAVVLGVSPLESPVSLYWRKVHGWDLHETDEMRAGRILEPAVADWWALSHNLLGDLAVSPSPLLAHPGRSWQLATPDRIVRPACSGCDGTGRWYEMGMWHRCHACGGVPREPSAVLECKWVAASWDGWGAPGTDDIPVHYRAQVQWQCDVAGVDTWHLAALGPSGFRGYAGRRDDRDIAVMVEHGRRFMARLESGDPPPLDDHHTTLDILRRLHPDLDDVTVEVPPDLAAGYQRAVRMRRLAHRVERRYEAQVRAAMGSARRATCAGRKVATRVVADVAAETKPRGPHRKDYLLPPRGVEAVLEFARTHARKEPAE